MNKMSFGHLCLYSTVDRQERCEDQVMENNLLKQPGCRSNLKVTRKNLVFLSFYPSTVVRCNTPVIKQMSPAHAQPYT